MLAGEHTPTHMTVSQNGQIVSESVTSDGATNRNVAAGVQTQVDSAVLDT
jgi:hypothetical protein